MPAQSHPRQESFVVAYRVSRLDSPPAPTRAGAIRAPRDERSAECVTDARIQIFIREHDLKNNEGLHAYFNRRVSEILHRHGKRIVGWDAILHPDLPADSIVQASDPGGLAKVAANGHSVILSHGYYIDLNYTAAENYLSDPLPANTTLKFEQQQHILGGEATMWSEWVTPEFIDTRIWPRTAAIAERLWSPREVCDIPDMYRRLAVIDVRLQEAGLQQHQWPRIELPGLDSESPVVEALRTLASVVEPVKDYRRLDLQLDCTQSTPLNELADWSRFDSRAARELNASVAQWLSAPGKLDAKGATALAAQLESWGNAGELAAQAPAAATPLAQGRTEMARSLAAVCRIGREAIQALMSGRTVADDWRFAAVAILDHAEQPNAAAVEFPFLTSLRQLVIAAAAARKEAPSTMMPILLRLKP